MALLAIEGFEGGGATQAKMEEYITRRYSYLSTSTYTSRSSGRFGGNSLRLSNNCYFGIPIDNKQTIIVGFAVKTVNLLDGEAILRLEDGGTAHIELQMMAAGELRLTRGAATVLGTTSGLGFLTDTWYYIELKVTIDDAAGAYELRVDGSNELSATGVDTNNGGNDYVTHVVPFGDPATTNYTYYDDMYVIDTSGSYNNDFLGNMKVVMLVPDGDTGDADFTPLVGPSNYEDVDEGAVVDDDTTYVASTTDGDKDIYDYEDIGDVTIKGIQLHTEFRIDDADSFDLKTIIKSNGTEYPDSGEAAAATYAASMRLAETNPDDGNLWTSTTLNAAKFGFESVDT